MFKQFDGLKVQICGEASKTNYGSYVYLVCRMFYFFFESRKDKTDPVVIWLTGGPGCGSELALFYENGPFKIANNLSLVWNNFGWDKVFDFHFYPIL